MRIHVLAATLLVVSTISAAAQQKPNTLTRDEIEKGRLLLFDGAKNWGLAPISRTRGRWTRPTDGRARARRRASSRSRATTPRPTSRSATPASPSCQNRSSGHWVVALTGDGHLASF